MSEFAGIANYIHREVMSVMHRSTRRTPVVVDGYDKETHSARFQLMPGGNLTGWLPLATPQTGNQFGFYTPPQIGDHGWVEFHDDDREAGNFSGAVFDDVFKPLQVEAGEFLYQHKTGSQIYFAKGGAVTIRDQKQTDEKTNQDAYDTILLNGNKEIDVNAIDTINLTANNKNITLTTNTADIALIGQNNITLEAKAVDITITSDKGNVIITDKQQGNIITVKSNGDISILCNPNNAVYIGSTQSKSFSPVLTLAGASGYLFAAID
jgi:phage baseplate assembly protein gpV